MQRHSEPAVPSTSEPEAKRSGSGWAARAVSGIVCVAMLAAGAGVVWSQRLVAPVSGQSLNPVQAINAVVDLPRGWRAERLSGLHYVAIAPTGPLPKPVIDELAATIKGSAASAGSETYWPSAEADRVQKASGKSVVIVWHGHIDSGPSKWIIYEDQPKDTAGFAPSHAAALRQAARWAQKTGATVVDAG